MYLEGIYFYLPLNGEPFANSKLSVLDLLRTFLAEDLGVLHESKFLGVVDPKPPCPKFRVTTIP